MLLFKNRLPSASEKDFPSIKHIALLDIEICALLETLLSDLVNEAIAKGNITELA